MKTYDLKIKNLFTNGLSEKTNLTSYGLISLFSDLKESIYLNIYYILYVYTA